MSALSAWPCMAGGNGRWPWRKHRFAIAQGRAMKVVVLTGPESAYKVPCVAPWPSAFRPQWCANTCANTCTAWGARPVWPMSPRLPRCNGSASKRPRPCGRPCCCWIRIYSLTTNGAWRCLATAPPGLPRHWPSNTTTRCFYSAPKALLASRWPALPAQGVGALGLSRCPAPLVGHAPTHLQHHNWSQAIGNSATSRLGAALITLLAAPARPAPSTR